MSAAITALLWLVFGVLALGLLGGLALAGLVLYAVFSESEDDKPQIDGGDPERGWGP